MSIIAWVVQTTYGEWLEIEAYHDARTIDFGIFHYSDLTNRSSKSELFHTPLNILRNNESTCTLYKIS